MITRINSLGEIKLNKWDFVLDIETTGFSPKFSHISILGYIYHDGESFVSKQLLAESPEEEGLLLFELLKDVGTDSRIISFNGDSFDLPFIEKRLVENSLHPLIVGEAFDLYKYIKKYQAFSPYPCCGQKELENHFGLYRDEELNGKEAVQMYKSFLISHDQSISDKLLDYNFNDIYHLALMMDIYERINASISFSSRILDQDFIITYDYYKIKKHILEIHFISDKALEELEISYAKDDFKLVWDKKDLYLKLSLIHGKLDQENEGACFKYKGSSAFDSGIYDLKDQLVLIFDQDRVFEKNIAQVGREIILNSIHELLE